MNSIIKSSLFTFAAMVFAVPLQVQAETTTGVTSANRAEYSDGNLSRPNADNTAVNARDRDENTLTPLDQGNSQADTNATAAIRKAILDREGLSVNAQNVKIITSNGKVTLRGPVKTLEEKNFIAQTAGVQAGSENVNDQLEVTGNV